MIRPLLRSTLFPYTTLFRSSGSTVNDTSGNGNTGTWQNGNSWVKGEIGAAANFTSTYYIDAGSGSTLDDLVAQGNSGMTYEAWVKPGTSSNSCITLTAKSSDSNPHNGWSVSIQCTSN